MNQPKVLIADDNASIRRILTQYLGSGDREVLAAEDGDAALAMARSHLPDLIILDVRMPGRDGHQVFSELRLDDNTRRIPVIMLSGIGADDEDYRGVAEGADAYLSKPFNLHDLEDRVTALLGGRLQ